MTRAQTKPDTAQPEQPIDPLTQQDYGTAGSMAILSMMIDSPNWEVRRSLKVDANDRYVVEFEAIKVGSVFSAPPSSDPQD